MTEMKKRSLGQTGIEVSELGLGTWPLAGAGPSGNYGAMSDSEAFAIIETYVAGGGNLIDTARVYNNSETFIGKYLKQTGNRDSLILSSKTLAGQVAETLPDIDKDLETTLVELGTDYLDVYFLHFPPEDPEVMEAALEKMLKFKEEGKIRSIGASIKGPNVTAETQSLCDTYVATGSVDVLQVVYSILRQGNLSAIENAKENGVGVIVRTTLESGLLTGTYAPGHVFDETDHRSRYDRGKLDFILKTNEELNGFAVRPPYTNLAQTAVRFSLSAPGVSCIIMGAQSPDEVKLNLDTLDLPSLNPEVVAELRDRYGEITEKANFN